MTRPAKPRSYQQSPSATALTLNTARAARLSTRTGGTSNLPSHRYANGPLGRARQPQENAEKRQSEETDPENAQDGSCAAEGLARVKRVYPGQEVRPGRFVGRPLHLGDFAGG